MNKTTIANSIIATLELVEDGLRKLIYTSDRLQEKLELHKLAVIYNEKRKAMGELDKLRLAFDELERKRTLEVYAINAKHVAALRALDEAEARQVDKLGIAKAVLFDARVQYEDKAVSRGWVA